jgi:type VI secretion system protein ImpH
MNTDGSRADAQQALWAALQREPWAHDFFHTLRRLEAQHPASPRLGEALRPGAEPVRLGQDIELDFAPAALSSLEVGGQGVGSVPRLGVRFFGLFGPMGPMPLHLTEFVRERLRQHGDPTLARFADVFHHRALLLFYRAWAQAQPAVQRDRPADDDFARWSGAFIGLGSTTRPSLAEHVPDDALRHHIAHLRRGPRNAEGLEKLLASHFRVPVRVQPHIGHWLPLRREDRTRLVSVWEAGHRNRLGADIVAGSRVWDRQYRFRLRLGPLGLNDYERFMPGSPAVRALREWVRQFVGPSLVWDVQPVLRGAEVPALRLGMRHGGHRTRLGLSTWLSRRGPHPDRADRLVKPERPSPGDAHV